MFYPATELDALEVNSLDDIQPCIYFYLMLDGRINLTQLDLAIHKVHKIVPELACRYDKLRNGWVSLENHSIVYEVDHFDFSSWKITCDPQWCIQVMHHSNYDELAIGISHIISDGAGAKQLIQLLCRAYQNEALEVCKNIRELSTLDIRKSHTSKKKIHKAPVQHELPKAMTMTSEAIFTQSIELAPLLLITKQYVVTINDLFLTAFLCSLHNQIQDEILSVTCPVNLRAFLMEEPPTTITNFTGGYEVTLNVQKDCSQKDLLYEVQKQMLKERICNRDLSLIKYLHRIYHILPLRVVRFLVKHCYHVPKYSLTNLGILEHCTFGSCDVTHVKVVTAMHSYPCMQVALLTYDEQCTLSIHMRGSEEQLQEGNQILHNIVSFLQLYQTSNDDTL